MRILQILNYPAWIKVSRGEQPSHHLFGMHEFIESYEKLSDYKFRGLFYDNNGYVDFLLIKDHLSFIDSLKLFALSFKYDIIYDCLCCVTKYLGLLFRFIRPCSLVTILHHPPYDKILKYTRSDAYIFLDEKYAVMARYICPSKKDLYFTLRWEPDLKWYENKVHEIGPLKLKYFFIDNGKTYRDHEILVKSIYNISAKSVLINKLSMKPSCFKEGDCLDYITQEAADDVFILRYLLQSKCVVIPCKLNPDYELLGPIGNTSFMDAIALGMPIICSDNLYFADDVLKYNLGLVYKAGCQDSLERMLKKMYLDNDLIIQCSKNMVNYRKRFNISQYGKKVFEIFNYVLNKYDSKK